LVAAAFHVFSAQDGQFADVIPFDQIQTGIVIENHLCLAVLKYCDHSSVAGSKAVLNPCISSDKLTIAARGSPGLSLVI
jgi:hypothetical protein